MPDSLIGEESGSAGLSSNEFQWNGKNSSYYGIVMLAPPTIIIPKERYSSVTIPGRAGSLYIKENEYVYDNVQLSCTCLILNTEAINNISYWLRGEGLLLFGNIGKNHYYRARIANQISFEKVLRGNKHRTFTIQFDCEPFVYLRYPDNSKTYSKTTDEEDLSVDGTVISLEGVSIGDDRGPSVVSAEDRFATKYFYSEPKLKLKFVRENDYISRDIKIYVFGDSDTNFEEYTTTTLLYDKVYNPSTGKRRISEIILDSETKIAYNDEKNLSYMVAGDWPVLPPNFFKLIVDSHLVSSVEFTPRWRSLI